MPPIEDDDLLEGLDDATDDSLPGDPPEAAPKRAPAKEEKLPKMSIREAITNAKDKLEGKEEKKDVTSKPAPKKEEVKKEAKKVPERNIQPTKVEALNEDEDTSTSEEDSPPVEDKPKVVATSKYAAPVGWTKEAKAEFNTLPEHVKASVAKREEEVSKGFKEYGEKAKQLEVYENLVKHHAPDHQQIGVTAPQLVDRLFQWFNSIRSPDKAHAVNSFKQLARNFNLEKELSESYGSVASGEEQHTNPENSELAQLRQELAQLKGSITQNNAQSAQARVNSWAKDKPHFEKVRNVMRALLESGVIPEKDGWLDLDTAYDRAVKADPELSQLALQEALEKKEAEFADSLAQKEAKRKADLERAKKANVSLKSGAPAANQTQGKASDKKKLSVRDSILLARQEVRGT